MRHPTSTVALLLLLAAALPFVIAAAPATSSRAPVLLAAGVVEVGDEPTLFQSLFALPDAATWATIRNDSPGSLLLGTDSDITTSNAWTLGPGEEITFAVTSVVHLRVPTGSARIRMLAGRY